jgi:hypothetical protein
MTKPYAAQQADELAPTAEPVQVPVVYRPEAFSVDDDLEELRQLREQKGPDYGRAIRGGRKIPLVTPQTETHHCR